MRRELALDLRQGQGPEGEALQPGDDGRADLAGVRRAEDEEDPRRWLLEGLEKDVPALLDALHLVDDEDLAAQVGRTRVDARDELAHVVDLVVGGGVQLDDVERPTLADGGAARAGIAGLAVAEVGAVDGLGHDPRHGRLARPAGAHEEEAMADPVQAHGVAERLDDRALADHLAERLGTEAPIERLPGAFALRAHRAGAVGHRSPWPGPRLRGPVPDLCGVSAQRGRQDSAHSGAGYAVHPPSITTAREPDRGVRLGPGRSAAPGEQRLTLLPSGPDVVHASPLRGTRSSTPIAPLASAGSGPREGIQPCWSGLQVQGTASSPPSTA